MQPNREPVGELKTNGVSPNAIPAGIPETQLAGGSSAELHELLNALQSMRVGDFSVRMPASEIGVLGKIASAALKPHLKQVENRPLPLAALSLGDVRLHDLQISVIGPLDVTAKFGSAG